MSFQTHIHILLTSLVQHCSATLLSAIAMRKTKHPPFSRRFGQENRVPSVLHSEGKSNAQRPSGPASLLPGMCSTTDHIDIGVICPLRHSGSPNKDPGSSQVIVPPRKGLLIGILDAGVEGPTSTHHSRCAIQRPK